MCDTCGCEGTHNKVTILKPGEENKLHSHGHHSHGHGHEHDHDHPHHHTHEHDHPHGKTLSNSREIIIEQDVLSKNNLLAERNRGYFEAKNIFTINLVSSPGSGKTSLLVKTIEDLGSSINFHVIEGDQQTMNDAIRVEAAGAPVVQVNTGSGCHLDAEMINQATKKLEIPGNGILMIENVGNLVCPSLFDLGESKRVVIISVTEGEDKPAKYPNMFASADLCIINKIDLLPYVDFSIDKTKEYALQVNQDMEFIELSVKTGEGIEGWYNWLKKQV
ncbi:MAG: hydrogenase nickel incorporation protein HypB [Bacteroidota bacterium]